MSTLQVGAAEFPPLASLFLTHFDDIKGQSVIFYASIPNLPASTIEHTTLPSGLHALDSDLVLFTHHDLPGAGEFRSRLSDEGARGRRMGTLGVVLAGPSTVADLFTLRQPLSNLFDQLESLESSPFAPSSSSAPSSAVSLLAKVWHECRADAPGAEDRVGRVTGKEEIRGVRTLVDGREGGKGTGSANGRGTIQAEHPIAYMPSLLGILGPSIVPIYRAALSGQRIILYSTPPLLPLAAFAWCIWAMSLAPPSTPDAEPNKWLGNVGLMDLSDLKKRKGGWVATTSDAIYRSHHDAYDVIVDLSSISLSSPITSSSITATPTPIVHSTYHQPKNQSTIITYAFSDLPLYRSLLLLTSSPPTVHAGVSRTGGWWLLAFEILERAWKLCVGVCEFAVGRGRVGETDEGHLRLDEGEEDARLLDDVDVDVEDGEPDLIDSQPRANNDDDDGEAEEDKEDEAIRRGRLILRQLHHNTYHLHHQLRAILASRSDISQTAPLKEAEIKQLIGDSVGRWSWAFAGGGSIGGGGSGAEVAFWKDVSRVWGLTSEFESEAGDA
ncbi:hypothetical protein I317_00876 [Kwoniella heveanensis CBS 569]|nr:hypothetical protein I317_00876 [Kwoniella heveanensis CBS 569]